MADFPTNLRCSPLHPNNSPSSQISMEVGVMFGGRWLLLSLCLTSICVPPSAQTAAGPAGIQRAVATEGEAIVQAAWQVRRGLFPKPDCSHFVHAVYTQAGFLYEYAASRAIFAGIDGFRRVTKPQTGDVIVWQGHIGIVIDPKEHSFYSSVTSGFAIESYQSRYWIGRGIPLFYRFVVSDLPGPPPLLADLARRRSTSRQVLSSLTQSFPGRPPRLMQSETAQILAQSDSLESSAAGSAQVRPARIQEQRPVVEDWPAQIQASEVATNNTQMSHQVLVTSRPTPAKKEVLAAVRGSADANGERLLQDGSLASQPSGSVVDPFRIVAVNLQGNSGLADLGVKQMGAFEYGKAIPKRTTARRHVILSRQEQAQAQAQRWVLVMPQDLICLNRQLAVMALTDHLATVPPTPANRPELKASRRLLHELSSQRKLCAPPTS